MSSRTSKKELPTVLLWGSLDDPSAGLTLSKSQVRDSHQHSRDSAKNIFKLGDILLSEFIPTAADLHLLLQEHDLAARCFKIRNRSLQDRMLICVRLC